VPPCGVDRQDRKRLAVRCPVLRRGAYFFLRHRCSTRTSMFGGAEIANFR
jgi:hypothetical protein